MIRTIALTCALLALAGCRADVEVTHEGLSAHDLERAYDRCIEHDYLDKDAEGKRVYHEADFNKRLACTQAIYGGNR